MRHLDSVNGRLKAERKSTLVLDAKRNGFEIEVKKIGEGHFVRVTFPDGTTEPIYGFATKTAAIKWIRCEAVVWLWQRCERLKLKEVVN